MSPPHPTSRAVSPAVGSVLLVAVAVVLAGVTVAAVDTGPPDERPSVALGAHVDATTDRVSVRHRGGDPLVPSGLSLRLTVAGEPVAHQPPVPFFAAHGFVSGPTGPFNEETNDSWTAGERASLRLAGTNTEIERGEPVTLRLSYRGRRLAVLRVRAQ